MDRDEELVALTMNSNAVVVIFVRVRREHYENIF